MFFPSDRDWVQNWFRRRGWIARRRGCSRRRFRASDFPIHIAAIVETMEARVLLSSDAAISTFASSLAGPVFEAFDASGNLYVSNYSNNTISKITPAGSVSTFVSSGLNNPQGLAFDAGGNLYAANNYGNTISKITPEGAVSTFVSSGLGAPGVLAFDASGSLYAANTSNATISKITPAGDVSTFVFSGLADPFGLAFDASGNLYVANSDSNLPGGDSISKITPAGTVSTFASSGLNNPTGLAFDAGGNLYVADAAGNAISKITPAGDVSTLLSLNGPIGLAFDASGNLYAANTNVNTITKITLSTVSATEGISTGNVTLATFTNANPLADVTDFTLSVNWVAGGGALATPASHSESIQLVSRSATQSTWAVVGSATYAESSGAGTYTPAVTVTDVDTPATQLVMNDTSFRVTDALLTAGALTPPVATEGVAFSNVTVFHFTDADPDGMASDYTATVNTGDATLTSAANPGNVQIVANGGGFDVRLSYTYAEELSNAPFSVQFADAGGASTGATAGLDGRWTTVAPMPEPNGGAAYGVIAGKIYIIGDGGGHDGKIAIYDPVANTWSTGASNPISPSSPAGGVINGKLYAAGGNSFGDGNRQTAALEVYDPTTDSWSSKAPMLLAVTSAAAGVINGKLYVAGGNRAGLENGPFMNTLQVYDPATDTWAYKAPMPTPLGYLDDNGVVINGLLYVAGGSVFYPNGVATLEVYDPNTDTWTTKASMPTARSSPEVGELGGILYVAGGRAGLSPFLTTVESYNPATDTWTTEPSLPSARNASIAVGLNGVLYVLGGSLASGSGDNTVYAFTPSSSVTVQDAPLTITALAPPAPVEGIPMATATVATFSDANSKPDINDFTATIAWGDGNTSTATAVNGGIIANADGTFSVLGSNMYGAAANGLTFSVTIDDAGGASVAVSATINVTKQSTTTALSESSATATYGDEVKFTATVIPQFSGVPSGTATFYEVTSSGDIISQFGTSDLNSSGIATFRDSVLSAGTHYVAAAYTSGDRSFTASGLSSLVRLIVSAKSITGVIAAYSKVYDGSTAATLYSTTLTGVLAADVGNVTLTVGAANFSDASAGTNKLVTATGLALTGSAAGNYVLSSTTATTTANITPKDLTVSGSTQNSINIAKAGTLTFAISNVSGEITGDTRTTYQLFNGALFTLRIGSNTYSVVSTASVDASTGTIYVSWRLSDELYKDLLAVLGTGTPSAKQFTDLIVVGYSNDGNYRISADCMTQIFSSGKVIWS